MRFAIAATVLASQQLSATTAETSQDAIGTHHENNDKTIKDWTRIQQKQRRQQPPQRRETAGRIQQRLSSFLSLSSSSTSSFPSKSKLLRNEPKPQVLQECDPTATTSIGSENDNVNDAVDVGILGVCPTGQYCIETTTSSLGGYCHRHRNDNDEDDVKSSSSSPNNQRRDLQEDNDMVLDETFEFAYQVFCNTTDNPDAELCECTDINATSSTLTVACIEEDYCNTVTSVCDVNITNCFVETFNLSVTGPDGVYTYVRCFEDSTPYVQKNCYYGISTGNTDTSFGLNECAITLDDVTCTDCTLSQQEVEVCTDQTQEGEGGAITGGPLDCYTSVEDCFVFDCTNTLSRKAGNTCDDGVYIPPILYYLQTYGCDDLYICGICGGEDFVSTKPNGIIDLGDGATTCAAVHQVALLGGFNETFCQDVVIPGVATDCGCTMLAPPTDGPPSSPTTPTDPPAMSPTDPTPSPITSGSDSTILQRRATIVGLATAVATAAATTVFSWL